MTESYSNDTSAETVDPSIATAALAFTAMFSGKPDTEQAADAEEGDAEDASTEEDAEAHDADASDDDADAEEGDEPETADDDAEATDDEDDAPRVLDPATDKATVKIKLGDTVEEISLEEVAKSYLRQQDYTRKSQQLAENRKAVEVETEAARGKREYYAEMIERLDVTLKQFDHLDQIDFDELYRTDPHRYVYEVEAKRERDNTRLAAVAEKQKIEADRRIEAQKAHAARADATWEAVKAAMPAWQDQKVWAKDQALIMDYAREAGFTPDEIKAACSTDHRVLLSMHAAAQYARLMQNKPASKAPASAPVARTVSRANAPKAIDSATRAKMRLKETGSIEDAAEVFSRLFK